MNPGQSLWLPQQFLGTMQEKVDHMMDNRFKIIEAKIGESGEWACWLKAILNQRNFSEEETVRATLLVGKNAKNEHLRRDFYKSKL